MNSNTLKTLAVCAVLLGGAGTQMGGCDYNDSSTSASRVDDVSIPHRATVVREGEGALTFTARSDGHVYAYDADDRAVVNDRQVRSGQEYSILPDQNRITLDGKKVFDNDLKKKHTHRIYFASDRRNDSDDRGGRDSQGNTDDTRLPRSAKQMVDGRGRVSYTPRDDGRAYVYDEDDDRVVFSRSLRDGDRLDIDSEKNRISVNGKSVFDGDLNTKHSFRIYYDKN